MHSLCAPLVAAFNTVLFPVRDVAKASSLPPVRILWSRMSQYRRWEPNHFIPVLDVRTADIGVDNEPTDLDDNDYATITALTSLLDEDGSNTSEESSPKRSKTVVSYRPLRTHDELYQDGEATRPQEHVIPEVTSEDPRVQNLYGRFLDASESYMKLKGVIKPEDRFEGVPMGKKSNVAFPVDYTSNLKSRLEGDNCAHVDDFGVWSSKSCRRTTAEFVINSNQRLDYVTKRKDGKYYRNHRDDQPIEPQPDDLNIIQVNRYYGTLKRDPRFRKRISWFLCGDDESSELFRTTALVEYLGEYPVDDCIHGNRKKGNVIYTRTNTRTAQKIREDVQTGKPTRAIYTDALLDDEDNCPRNLKQVQNAKAQYTSQKRKHEDGRQTRSKNIADDIQRILSQAPDSEFIQEIITTNDSPPALVLYTHRQLEDLRKLTTDGNLIGIDRTFNLGPTYVTINA